MDNVNSNQILAEFLFAKNTDYYDDLMDYIKSVLAHRYNNAYTTEELDKKQEQYLDVFQSWYNDNADERGDKHDQKLTYLFGKYGF